MLAPIFIKSKEEALPDVKDWLVTAFREKKGYFVPKKEVFGAYADFCSSHGYESTTPASFGKFLKKIFPRVETRRLIRNNEQAMYYYNLTSTASPSSSRRWTSVQSSSSSTSSSSPPPALSSSMPASGFSASPPSLLSSTSSTKRRRASSLADSADQQRMQRLARSASPVALASALPPAPTFNSLPEGRRGRSMSHGSGEGGSLGSSTEYIHDLADASLRRIKEERLSPQQQQHQRHRLPKMEQHSDMTQPYWPHPYYHMLTGGSGADPLDTAAAAATYDASAWTGMEYLYPLMTALPHQAMAIAAAAAQRHHHQLAAQLHQLERLPPLASPPLLFTTTATTTTSSVSQQPLRPVALFPRPTPYASAVKEEGSPEGKGRAGVKKRAWGEEEDDGDYDLPLPAIKDEREEESFRCPSSPTADTSKKKSRLDFILN